MLVNALPKYGSAEKEYLQAESLEEKKYIMSLKYFIIYVLKKIKSCPKKWARLIK